MENTNTSAQDIQNFRENTLILIIYVLKKTSPNNVFYALLFFILKSLGLIILSHDFTIDSTKDSDFSINKLLRRVTFLGDLQSNFFTNTNYNIISLVIFFMITFPFIVIFIIYKILLYKKTVSSRDLINLKLTKFMKRILKFLSAYISIIALFSQHIVEILCFVILNAYVYSQGLSSSIISSTNSQVVRKAFLERFLNFNSGLLFGNYQFILFINILSFLIVNIILYNFLKFMNEPYLNSQSNIKISCSKGYLIGIVLMSNFQGFHYFAAAFEDSLQLKIKHFFLIFTVLFSIFYLLQSLGKFDFDIFINKMCDYINFLCFLSNILNLIIYYSTYDAVSQNTLDYKFSDTQIIFKLIIEIALAFIIFYFINNLKNMRLLKMLSKNLFRKNKNLNLNSLFTFCEMIENSINDSVKFLPIFRLIDNHKNFCTEQDCACSKYEFNKYLKNLDVSKKMQFLKNEEKLFYFKTMYHDIITLGENEIVNSIYQLFKSKNIDKNLKFILLHIDYIFHFKRNNLLSNYLIEQYRLNLKRLPFIFRFHFYIYKKKLVKYFYENLKINSTYSISSSFFDFYKYHQILQNINKFILKNCENFEKLLYIKKTFDNNQLELNRRDSIMEAYYKKLFNNIENIFTCCENLNKHFNKLCNILEKNFRTDRLRNIEMSYLLYNFFFLINKEIPFDMRNLFLMIDEYSIIESFRSSFDEKKMNHPLIVKADKGDGFIINYISQKLCDLIDYNKNELIGKDMHMLLPKIFQEQHKLVMKKMIFLEFDSKIQKESFLVTKSQFFFEVDISGTFLPTINEHVLLILDLFPLGDKRNSFNLKKNFYKFILDLNTNIISLSKNFEENFYFNLLMFKKTKINFCQFFDINYEKLTQKCLKVVKQVKDVKNNGTSDILKIFQQVDLNKALFFLSDENKFDGNSLDKKKQKCPISEFIRKKEKLIPTLTKIKKNIQEAEMDAGYLEKVNELEKKFYKNSSANKYVNVKRIVSKSFGLNVLNSAPTACDQIKQMDHDDSIFIGFYLNNLGNIPYFTVEVIENREIINNFQNNCAINNANTAIFYEDNNMNTMKSLRHLSSLGNKSDNQLNNNAINSSLNDSKILTDNHNIKNNIISNIINVNPIAHFDKNDIIFENLNSNIVAFPNKNQLNINFPSNNNLNNSNMNNSFNLLNSSNANLLKSSLEKNSTTSVTKYNYAFLKNIKTNKSGTATSFNFLNNLHINTNNMSITNNNNLIGGSNTNESLQQLLQFKSSYNLSINPNDSNNINVNDFSKFNYNNASSFLSSYTGKSNYLIRNANKKSKKKKGASNNKPHNGHVNMINNDNMIDKMKQIDQDQINSREKIIFVFLFFLLVIQIFLSFFGFSFKSSIAEFSNDLFNINFYALLTKLSLYYTSSSVISACTSIDINPPNTEGFSLDITEFQKQFKYRSNKLLKNLNSFMQILSKTDSSKNSEIYDLISSEIEFKILYSDWSSYSRKSTIFNEMSYFHYYIAELQYSGAFKTCRLRDYFFNQKFKNLKNSIYVDNNRHSESNANYEETVMFYIFYNVFQNFRENLEKITTNINAKFNTHLSDSEIYLLTFNLITLIFSIFLIMIVTYSIKNYREKILKIVFDIFIKDKSDPLFFERLKNFITIAKNFDKKICLEFEEENKRIFIEELIKLHYDPQLFNLNEEQQKNSELILNDNPANLNSILSNNNTFKNVGSSNVNTNPHPNGNNSSHNPNRGNFPNNNLSTINKTKYKAKNPLNVKNETNGNSGSGHNNSVSLTNENNNKNFSNNSNIQNNDLNTNNGNDNKFASDFSNINIFIVKISYLILIFAFFCYIALNVSNILVNRNQYKNLIIANQMSLNVLDRIPKFAELILYYRISVIFNDVDFITTTQDQYKSLIYSDYFDMKFTPNTESIFSTLKQSEFSHIYYNILVIRRNIDAFMRLDSSGYSGVLPNLRAFEKKINSQEFCSIYRMDDFELLYDDENPNAYGEMNNNNNNNNNNNSNNIYTSFQYLNSEAKECLKVGNGINKFGMNIALDSLLASSKNLYIDFYKSLNQGNIVNALNDKNFIRAVMNVEYTFNKLNTNYIGIIMQDMTALFESVKNSEFIFSCTGLVFNIVFIVFIIFGVIKKLQKYHISLNSAIEKFKVALIIEKN